MPKRSDYISWDEYFMGIAMLSAYRSKDPSTQVGACIVNDRNRIMSVGYNGFPSGCDDDEFPWEREGSAFNTKYAYVCHAELNAILNASGDPARLPGLRRSLPLQRMRQSDNPERDKRGRLYQRQIPRHRQRARIEEDVRRRGSEIQEARDKTGQARYRLLRKLNIKKAFWRRLSAALFIYRQSAPQGSGRSRISPDESLRP